VSDGFNGHIPRLVADGIGIIVGAQERRRVLHLIHKRRGQQNLGQQGIGIECDWREQVIELFSGKKLVAGIVLCRGGIVLGHSTGGRQHPGKTRGFQHRHDNHAVGQ
jgi:hypothetical protein